MTALVDLVVAQPVAVTAMSVAVALAVAVATDLAADLVVAVADLLLSLPVMSKLGDLPMDCT